MTTLPRVAPSSRIARGTGRIGAALLTMSFGLAACGAQASALSASSSCADFNKADVNSQAAVVQNLYQSAHPNEPDNGAGAANAMLNVAYECTQAPTTSLGSLSDFSGQSTSGAVGTSPAQASATAGGDSTPSASDSPAGWVPASMPWKFTVRFADGWSYQFELDALPKVTGVKDVSQSPPGKATLTMNIDGGMSGTITSLDIGRIAPLVSITGVAYAAPDRGRKFYTFPGSMSGPGSSFAPSQCEAQSTPGTIQCSGLGGLESDGSTWEAHHGAGQPVEGSERQVDVAVTQLAAMKVATVDLHFIDGSNGSGAPCDYWIAAATGRKISNVSTCAGG